MKRHLLGLLAFLCLAAFAAAVPVTITLDATITAIAYTERYPTGLGCDGTILVGDNLTLTATYDSDLPSGHGPDHYIIMSLAFPNARFDSGGVSNMAGAYCEDGATDEFTLATEGSHASMFRLTLIDTTGIALNGVALPASFDPALWLSGILTYVQPWGTQYTATINGLGVNVTPLSTLSVDTVDSVPDGGATALLLGLVLPILVGVKRLFG